MTVDKEGRVGTQSVEDMNMLKLSPAGYSCFLNELLWKFHHVCYNEIVLLPVKVDCTLVWSLEMKFYPLTLYFDHQLCHLAK